LPDGRIKVVRERYETYFDQNGRPLRLLGTVQDITDQKRAEEALQQREQDLRAALEERERISQDLHDGILQSLYAVGLGLESCKPLVRQGKHKQATLLLGQAIGQMNHVMAEVRNFIAGLESQVLQGGDFPTALRTMVQNLTASQPISCRLLIEERAVQQVSTEQALHLLNLVREALSNSLRHGRATRVTVSFKLLSRSIRLMVADNGRGFPPDRAEGVGRGLANMAARAQRMGGRFAVQSKPKEGTRITVELPKEGAYGHS
jgi:signal transduction histidine kinase